MATEYETCMAAMNVFPASSAFFKNKLQLVNKQETFHSVPFVI